MSATPGHCPGRGAAATMEDILGDGSHNNAMAECALALAMAFFSIMVLTMVSMGAGLEAGAATPPTDQRITIRPSAPSDEPPAESKAASPGVIVIHYRGRYYDTRLQPLAPGAIPAEGPAVLAIDPALSMAEAIAARRLIANPELTVTTLDERWLAALKETPK